MPIIPQTDQWKLYGDCDKCRRQPYCSKYCKPHKLRLVALAAKDKPFIT